MDERTDGRTDGQTDERTNERTDGRMGERTDVRSKAGLTEIRFDARTTLQTRQNGMKVARKTRDFISDFR